ncbi:hypothetical protein ACA910_004164 [Epithemia clementina (nom. ined.)]
MAEDWRHRSPLPACSSGGASGKDDVTETVSIENSQVSPKSCFANDNGSSFIGSTVSSSVPNAQHTKFQVAESHTTTTEKNTTDEKNTSTESDQRSKVPIASNNMADQENSSNCKPLSFSSENDEKKPVDHNEQTAAFQEYTDLSMRQQVASDCTVSRLAPQRNINEDVLNVTNSVAEKKRPSKGKTLPAGESHSTGRWTDAEHQAFLKGLQLYGREWKKVASHIPTRTSAQVRSHAQKHFVKMQRDRDALLILSSSRTNAPPSESGTLQQMASGATGEKQAAAVACGLGTGLSPESQSTLARILSNPQQVEAEVEETMQRLVRRYRQLQIRLQHLEQQERVGTDMVPIDLPDKEKRRKRSADISTEITMEELSSDHGLQDEELIALSVLHGTLPRSSGYMDGSGSSQESNDNTSELETMDTNVSCCSANANADDDHGADGNTTSDDSNSSSKRRKSTDASPL